MTKEELKKEVEEYLENEHCKNVCTHSEVEECKEGIRIKCMSFNCRKELIVNFAEPREKQIQALGERCLQLQKDKGNLTDRVRELEAQIEKMKCCENCAFFKEKTYDICHRIKKLGTRKCTFYKMM